MYLTEEASIREIWLSPKNFSFMGYEKSSYLTLEMRLKKTQ